MLVTLTVVVRLTTTLFTTRGPPQPPHQATPTNPGRPHQGMTGSPQPSDDHGTAEEDDERRRIHGPDDDGTGRPSPVASDEDPAAVVVRRPAPRRRVEPGPAEARIPDPPPRAVRHPPRRD